MIDGTIAVIGRPNVGKSTLFNRLIKTRLSIVDDQPGVTRDRLYGKVEWLTKTYRIIDTGGIELTDRPFQDQIRAQAEIAMEEADVIVFLCDGRSGVTVDDSHYDIVRNHIYEFEIRSVAGSNLVLEYYVADWSTEDWDGNG